jgi:hypothetical protein
MLMDSRVETETTVQMGLTISNDCEVESQRSIAKQSALRHKSGVKL